MAEIIFERVDGVMVPRWCGVADGRRYFGAAEAARLSRRTVRHMRTLHRETFRPLLDEAGEDPATAAAVLAELAGALTEAQRTVARMAARLGARHRAA